jgi:hypothetical protein
MSIPVAALLIRHGAALYAGAVLRRRAAPVAVAPTADHPAHQEVTVQRSCARQYHSPLRVLNTLVSYAAYRMAGQPHNHHTAGATAVARASSLPSAGLIGCCGAAPTSIEPTRTAS